MLSKKAKYALKALLYLTKQQEEKELVLISEIAVSQRIPKKFLEAILVELKTHGLLYSLRGKKGGYRLAQDPDKISVGQVVRLIDGPLAPIQCVSQLYYRRCEECTDEAGCEIRSVMKKVRDATALILDSTSILDMEKINVVEFR